MCNLVDGYLCDCYVLIVQSKVGWGKQGKLVEFEVVTVILYRYRLYKSCRG
jgi:hypothetical protein